MCGFALGHLIEIERRCRRRRGRHFDGGGGEAGGAHVLDGDDGVGGHKFEAGFDQQLFDEGIADLHGGALFVGVGTEFGAGHGGAVDAVAAGLAADIDDRIADAGGGG